MNELDSPILDLQPFLKHAGQIFPEGRLLFLVNNNNNNNNNKVIIITTTTTTTIIIIIIPYLPVYRPHFFQGKKVQNLGCGLYAGTRVLSSLICRISQHTQSQQSYWKLDSLIECIVWGQVNPCLQRILLLSAAMSVTSFRICLLLEWMRSKEVSMSSHEAPSMPFTWNGVCLQIYLLNYTKNTLNPSQKGKVINETDRKYHSFEV